MPDITMCTQTNCSHKKWCYRHECIPNTHYQYVAKYEPIQDNEKGFECASFIEHILVGDDAIKKEKDNQ